MGARLLHTARSKERRSWRMRRRSEMTKRMTAIMSCVQRKNRGASVALRTHLLLRALLARNCWQLEFGCLHHDHL